jgi:hypothetical protein
LAFDVIEGDEVAKAVLDLAQARGHWEGTTSELLGLITPVRPRSTWPQNPHALAAALTRCAPTLGTVGVEVTRYRSNDSTRTRMVRLIQKD